MDNQNNESLEEFIRRKLRCHGSKGVILLRKIQNGDISNIEANERMEANLEKQLKQIMGRIKQNQ